MTPSAIDSSELPPLEALFTEARRIHMEHGVAQYLRAHPSTDMHVYAHETEEIRAEVQAAAETSPKMTIAGGPWPVGIELEMDDVCVESRFHGPLGCDFYSQLGLYHSP